MRTTTPYLLVLFVINCIHAVPTDGFERSAIVYNENTPSEPGKQVGEHCARNSHDFQMGSLKDWIEKNIKFKQGEDWDADEKNEDKIQKLRAKQDDAWQVEMETRQLKVDARKFEVARQRLDQVAAYPSQGNEAITFLQQCHASTKNAPLNQSGEKGTKLSKWRRWNTRSNWKSRDQK